jgi:hypothetical protein
MNKIRYIFIAVTLLLSTTLKAQSAEEQSFKRALNAELGQTSGETAINVAKTFLGKPYVGQTLEKSPERLVCNLQQFDCYTLVENVIALTRMNNFNLSDYDVYQEMLTSMRYRDGKVDGYPSRIHYFTEWIEQAENNGIIMNMTKSWGRASGKKLDFMSKHPNYYPAMTDTKVRERIGRMESYVNQSPFFEIKKEDFNQVESKIKNGDIIVFTSTIAGLDVNHEGLAYWQNGKLHLLHASLDYKKVMISPETLGEYLQKIKKHQGIMVLRLM